MSRQTWIPERWDGDKCVDGDVRWRVRRETDHLTSQVTERPAEHGVLVGHERRADSEEVEVGDSKIQQQDVGGARAHVRCWRDDVDNERVSGDADDGDETEQQRRDVDQQQVDVLWRLCSVDIITTSLFALVPRLTHSALVTHHAFYFCIISFTCSLSQLAVIYVKLYRLVAWRSGRTLVFDRRTFPVLRSTCSWRVTTYVGKLSAVGQPTRPTKPFILSG